MRILIIAPDRTVRGGITTVIEGILASDLSKEYLFEHLSTHRDDISKFGKLIYGIKSYGRFLIIVFRFKPQLIHVHSSFGASFYRKSVIIIMSRFFRIKQINHIHGGEFDLFYKDAGRLKKKLVKFIYNIPEATILLSRGWLEKYDHNFFQNKVFCLSNFAVLPVNSLSAGFGNYAHRKNIVLYLGKVGAKKGAYDIPLIVEKVAKSISKVHFIISGYGDIEKVARIFNEKGCSRMVTFTGWLGPEQKKEWLLKARVYLLPSYDEGFPMSILEAMSYGLPIVSTCVGGIPELVRPEENGLLYQPGDTDGMADGIIKLLQNQDYAIGIGRRNRSKIENGYSLEIYASKLSKIYRQTALKKIERGSECR